MHKLYYFYGSGPHFKEGKTSSHALCEISTKAVLIGVLKILFFFNVPNRTMYKIAHIPVLYIVL